MQLLFCCWEHLAVDTEAVPAGNTDTLSFSGEAGLGDLPHLLCGELRYLLCLYLSHYNPCKYVTNFCLLGSICSAIFASWPFSQRDKGLCFLSSKTTSSTLAVRLWWAMCCLGPWRRLWVSHTMALSSLSWWPVSGQPHLFKVSQAGIAEIVERVLCLLMS